MPKRIGLLFGMEDTFPWALIRAIDALGRGDIVAAPVELDIVRDDGRFDYALILDRISHEVPFYRTFLKVAAGRGITVINSPFWSVADDKFFGNVVAAAVGVAVPRTVLLPHKERPPSTQASSFRNLRFVDWEATFGYLQFPIFLKPAYGGGWKDVYKVDNRHEFFEAYDRTRDLAMMAQEAIDFDAYFRCYALGRERIRIMRYDPKAPFHERYVRDAPPLDPKLERKLRADALTLSSALGYDMNTVELAMRDGTPYAIDFTNPAPDADLHSIGAENFEWVVETMAEILVDRVRRPRPFELTGSWPAALLGTHAPTGV